ncbi:UrcA family protein [Novosphingobium sp. BL-8H]|uniref:UrcA family protein n=1 Tax=Novosphingobium sp. BL-8H TaxID=3127640 RepID=UPI003758070D
MMQSNIRNVLTFAALVVSAASAPAMARAGTDAAMMVVEDRPTEEVHYADLDLGTPQGRAQLDTRIATAVDHVCGSADIRDLPAYADMRTCRTQSTQQAFAARDTVLAARDHGGQVAVLAVARGSTAGRSAR